MDIPDGYCGLFVVISMYNIILDKLPTEYEGYLIRTSFRIGMQINLCLQDDDFSEQERVAIALSLLYGNGVPDIDTAIEGLEWFISCGVKQNKSVSTNNKTLMYWDFDASRIYSSFQSTYNIDLTKEDMHWFKFIALLGSINDDSALSRVIDIRSRDISDLKGKARQDMINLKHSLTPPVEYTDEEQAKLDEFNKLLAGGDING